jgi:HlyD family secretion protein
MRRAQDLCQGLAGVRVIDPHALAMAWIGAARTRGHLPSCIRGYIIRRMIKNSKAARILVVFGLVVLEACWGDEREFPLQGVIEYDDRIIGVELGARVLHVGVERGASVAAKARLLQLDDGLESPLRDLRAAELAAAQAQLDLLRRGTRGEELEAAEAEIEALKAQEGLLEKNLARQSQLQSVGASTAASIDQLSAEVRSTREQRRALDQRLRALRKGARSDEVAAAQARVQGAAASLAAIEARLLRYVLESPVAGTVIDVHVKAGEMIAAGAPAISLADLDHPFVDVFVPQAQLLPGLKVGSGAQVRVDGAAQPLGGRVEHVFARTEFTPRFLFSDSERPNLVVRVRVRIDDPSHSLHAGVPAFVAISQR